MQKILAQLFESIFTNDKEDIDLKDRAAFYYRCMFDDIEGF
jgi:hypothetical protein